MAVDINLYCEQLKEFGQRLASSNHVVREAAHRDYELCAGPPGFAERLMEITHVSAARACLRRQEELSAWERKFLGSIAHFHMLSPKQRATLKNISARVLRGAP